VFLFDEPLSNLDAELRVEMRVEIARLHREIGATMIYVTHDQVEAMTLADKIVVLRAGRVEQIGAPMDLYNDPNNRFVAGFIGSPSMNFLSGELRDRHVVCGDLRSEPVPTDLGGSGAAIIGVRPQNLTLDPAGETHRVEHAERLGGVTYVHLSAPSGARLIVEVTGDSVADHGTRTGVSFDPATVMAFDRETEARIR
jgi:lactose/L-arabinose transport system ATP-binding protein